MYQSISMAGVLSSLLLLLAVTDLKSSSMTGAWRSLIIGIEGERRRRGQPAVTG